MDNATIKEPVKIDDLQNKMLLSGTVKKITLAGAIVDIGLEVPGVLHISQLQKEPVKRVEDVLENGQQVEVWIRRVIPKKQRIELTMIEPLDLEWREIKQDMVIKGKVIRLEKFGAFVEIGAERPGLVHISELTHDYIRTVQEVVKEGDEVEVKVLDVNRHKKQIKLSMKALEEKPETIVQQLQGRRERRNKPSKEEKISSTEGMEAEEPIPTAMEMALREAMEKVKEPETVQLKKPQKGTPNALEDILDRTLNQKVSTK